MNSPQTARTPLSQDPPPQWTFADRMRKIRRDVLGIEQADFAQKLGVTRQAYAAWEAARNEPRSILAVARQVEAISGVSAAWILGVDAPFLAPQNQAGQTGPNGAYVDPEVALVTRFPQLTLMPTLPAPRYADVTRRNSPERTSNHLRVA